MDVTGAGFNSRGSFGIPEQVKRQMETTRPPVQEPKQSLASGAHSADVSAQGAAQEQAHQSQKSDVVGASASADAEKKATDNSDIETVKKFYEGRLGIKITEKDVRDAIFKGKLIKEGVVAIPGVLHVTFQSLTGQEYAEVERKVADFRVSQRTTEGGEANEIALRVLSYGWIKSAEVDAGEVKGWKSMGATPDERYANINGMLAKALQEITDAWKAFDLLVSLAFREQHLIKK